MGVIVDEHFPAAVDTFQHVETSSSHSAVSGKSGLSRRNPHDGGRKSSVPKKLRLSDDRESDVSSPRAAWPAAQEDQLHRGTSPLGGRASLDILLQFYFHFLKYFGPVLGPSSVTKKNNMSKNYETILTTYIKYINKKTI